MRMMRPKAGLKIPDPERGGYLPAGGSRVPDTAYWRRRLRDGEVEPVPEPPVAPASVSTFAPPSPAPEPPAPPTPKKHRPPEATKSEPKPTEA